jgi:hypothetical protein
MKRLKSGWAAALVAAWTCMAGCGPAESPLGGPYGGTEPAPGPTTGTSSTGDDGGTAGGSTSDASSSSGSSSSGSSSSGSGNGGNSSSGGSSGDSGASSSSGGGAAPTWAALYQSYLASGTEGHCASCHSETSSASGTYTWLQGRGYIAGTTSTLVASGSCLTWFGGNMPPGGPNDAQAASDMTAWAADGAQNN